MGIAALVVALVLGVTAVTVRFRRSRGVERAQLKWFVAANVAVGTFLMLGLADGGFLGLVAGTNPTILDLLAYASFVLPPIAVGIAILRYRLFEIDRLIARTLSWAHRHRAARRRLRGSGRCAAGRPRRLHPRARPSRSRRPRSWPSRCSSRCGVESNRPSTGDSIEPTTTRSGRVAEFSDRLRDEVDLAALSGDLDTTIRDAISPRSFGIWLRESQR